MPLMTQLLALLPLHSQSDPNPSSRMLLQRGGNQRPGLGYHPLQVCMTAWLGCARDRDREAQVHSHLLLLISSIFYVQLAPSISDIYLFHTIASSHECSAPRPFTHIYPVPSLLALPTNPSSFPAWLAYNTPWMRL